MSWTGLSTGVATALQLAQVAVLARLLDADEFGLMAITLGVVGFGQAFADMGISNVIIARRLRSRDVLSSLYWANVAGGIAVAGLIALASGAISAFYGQPELRELLLWSCLVFLLGGVGQQFQVLLQRDFKFRALAWIEIASATTGAAVSITAAVAGAGALALVWGYVATALAKSGLLAADGWSRWRPQFRFSLADLREHIGFGGYQMGERAVSYLASDIDYLLIGKFVGAGPLGAYMIGYQLVIVPLKRLAPILVRVAFPVLSKVQHDLPRMGRGYLELLRTLGMVGLPPLALVAAVGPLLVPVAFGSGWDTTVSVLPALAVVGAAKLLDNPTGALYLARNRPDVGFWENVALLLVLAAAILAAAQSGVVAVAIAYACVAVTFFFVSRVLVARLTAVSVGWQLRVLASGGLAATVAGATALVAQLLLGSMLSEGWDLLVTLVAAAPAGLALLWGREREYVTGPIPSGARVTDRAALRRTSRGGWSCGPRRPGQARARDRRAHPAG